MRKSRYFSQKKYSEYHFSAYTHLHRKVDLLLHTEKRYLWLAVVNLSNCLSIIHVYSKIWWISSMRHCTHVVFFQKNTRQLWLFGKIFYLFMLFQSFERWVIIHVLPCIFVHVTHPLSQFSYHMWQTTPKHCWYERCSVYIVYSAKYHKLFWIQFDLW